MNNPKEHLIPDPGEKPHVFRGMSTVIAKLYSPLTDAQQRALEILDKRPLGPREFGRAMWPDNNMHRKVSNTGNGATTGKAGWLCAGSYLAKLANKGLVKRRWNCTGGLDAYEITTEGKEQLLKTKNRHDTNLK
jgi:hypothetical protein